MFFNVLILCWISTIVGILAKPQSAETENTSCYTPSNQIGLCVPIESCGSLYQLIQKVPLYPEDRNYLRASQCGYNQQPYVCCPDSINLPDNNGHVDSLPNLLPVPGVCGQDNTLRTLGPEITKIGEFPWMALIEYSKPNNERGLHCGGVLISNRYVLTAAHCTAGLIKQLKWTVASVRLGEWDTNSETDCDQGDCSEPALDVDVEEVLPHENYNPNSKTQENDIALLRLSQPVTYTVSFNNFPRRGTVPGIRTERCDSVYNVTLGVGQLCTGIRPCRGDSGGRLMALDRNNSTNPYWYCAGILSFGPLPCDMEGWPGVYTRVGAYTDWILRNIRA